MTTDYRALCAELTEALCRWVEPWSGPEYETELVIKDVVLIDRARTALAEPQPPADGEVGELVAELKGYIEQGTPLRLVPSVVQRAADLLERLALQPIPVSERLPELRGQFERILCVARSNGGPTVGNIQLADRLINAVRGWLPAQALPVPEDQP